MKSNWTDAASIKFVKNKDPRVIAQALFDADYIVNVV